MPCVQCHWLYCTVLLHSPQPCHAAYISSFCLCYPCPMLSSRYLTMVSNSCSSQQTCASELERHRYRSTWHEHALDSGLIADARWKWERDKNHEWQKWFQVRHRLLLQGTNPQASGLSTQFPLLPLHASLPYPGMWHKVTMIRGDFIFFCYGCRPSSPRVWSRGGGSY
jgi:hypothetical protein